MLISVAKAAQRDTWGFQCWWLLFHPADGDWDIFWKLWDTLHHNLLLKKHCTVDWFVKFTKQETTRLQCSRNEGTNKSDIMMWMWASVWRTKIYQCEPYPERGRWGRGLVFGRAARCILLPAKLLSSNVPAPASSLFFFSQLSQASGTQFRWPSSTQCGAIKRIHCNSSPGHYN